MLHPEYDWKVDGNLVKASTLEHAVNRYMTEQYLEGKIEVGESVTLEVVSPQKIVTTVEYNLYTVG